MRIELQQLKDFLLEANLTSEEEFDKMEKMALLCFSQ